MEQLQRKDIQRISHRGATDPQPEVPTIYLAALFPRKLKTLTESDSRERFRDNLW